MKMYKLPGQWFIVLLFSMVLNPAIAKENLEQGKVEGSSSFKRIKARCVNASAKADLDINNVRARILNGGDMWWDLVGSPKYEVPKVPEGSSEPRRHALFAGSIWIGGLYNGNIYSAAQTYRQFGSNDYWAGAVDTTTATLDDKDCQYWDRIFQITKEEVDAHIAQFENPAAEIKVSDNVRNWPGNGRKAENEGYFMAPYKNMGGSPAYEPELGDYPDILGDQALWFVYNDVGNLKTETNSLPIGLELRTMAFAFQTNDEINNMTFYKTTIANRGNKQLDTSYFGQWVDPDLGYAFDDYVGCDPERGLGICYNGDNFDDGAFGYGSNPPSIGVDFFEGPIADAEILYNAADGDKVDNDGDGQVDELDTTYYYYYRANKLPFPKVYEGDGIDNNHNGLVDEPMETINMSKFVYYNNDFSVIGNPSQNVHYYNYLRGRWKNGECIKFGGNGFTTGVGCTDYMFPDDPRNADGWSEVTSNNQPADRRFIQSAGPFTLKPGAVNEVTVGVIWSRASSGGNTGSYDLLLLADDKAQKLFNNNFKLLNGPGTPDLRSVELDKEIVLIMDREQYVKAEAYTESEIKNDGGYITYNFQGYQLYQLVNSQVANNEINDPDQARLVWQSDLKDGITKLVNREFDPVVDENVASVKAEGSDLGVNHVINITEDQFASGNTRLINHTTYHYMLVAYASADKNNPDADIQYLAGRKPVRISVTPNMPESRFGGNILGAGYGDGPEITRIEGNGTGGVALDLTEETENEILAKGIAKNPKYKGGHGPVQIKVIDPFLVPSSDFEIRFIDKKVAGTDGVNLTADISNLINDATDKQAKLNIAADRLAEVADKLDEIKMVYTEYMDSLTYYDAIINDTNVTKEDSLYAVAAKMVLDKLIAAQYILLDDSASYDKLFSAYNTALNDYTKSETKYKDNLKIADSVLWEITKINDDGSKTVVKAEKPLFTDNEMVLDEWGFSVVAGMNYGPGESSDDRTNGFIEGSLEFEDPTIAWLTSLKDADNPNTTVPSGFDWIRSGGNFPQDAASFDVAFHDTRNTDQVRLDEKAIYETVADGIIAPYVLCSRSTKTATGISTYGIAQGTSMGLETGNFKYLPSIDLVFTSDRDKWTKVLVVEMGEDPTRTEGGVAKFNMRDHASLERDPDGSGNPVYSSTERGFSWFPGYAINVETGERLNIIMGENTLLKGDNARDMMWNPTAQITNPDIPSYLDGGIVGGGMHYLYVMGTKSDFKIGSPPVPYTTRYDSCKTYKRYLDSKSPDATTTRVSGVYAACVWAMPAMMASSFKLNSWKDGLIPTTARVRARVNKPYQTFKTSENPQNDNMPLYVFNSGNIAPEISVENGTEALKEIRVVPNPYYAQSSYERVQTDNIVKLTNLPPTCKISIYTVNGQLVRTFNKAEEDNLNYVTDLQWDLKNEFGVPIASGVYVIHIDAFDRGEAVVKFFAAMKPLDLDTF